MTSSYLKNDLTFSVEVQGSVLLSIKQDGHWQRCEM